MAPLQSAGHYLSEVSVPTTIDGLNALRFVRNWWLAPLLCTLVSIGMFASSPTMAAPDAEIHLGTAWYDIHHGFVSGTSRINIAAVGPCFDLKPQLNASCRTALDAQSVLAYTGRLVYYPPPFYWVMGVGELAMSVVSSSLVGDGGRLMGLTACLLLIFLAAWRLHRARERSAIWSLYLLTPPMTTFLFANANPSGWEIATAVFFAATLLVHQESLVTGTTGIRAALSIGIAGLLLSTARPDSSLWVIAIAGVFALWSRAWKVRSSMVTMLIAILPGIVLSVVWELLFPFKVQIGKPALSGSIGELISASAASMQDVVSKVPQIWGVLGWADTVPSSVVLVGVLAVLMYFLPTYAPTRSHRRLLLAIIAIVFSSSVVLEALGWRSFPYWWQGRYSLSLLAGLSMFLFSDPGRRERPRLFALAAWVTVFNAYMICVNYWRYDYGILNGLPDQVRHAAYGPFRSAGIYGIALVLAASCVVLFLADRDQRIEELGGLPTIVHASQGS
jgi:hypothetical protein